MPNNHVAQKTWIVAAIAAAITGAAVYTLTSKPQAPEQAVAIGVTNPATSQVAEVAQQPAPTLPAAPEPALPSLQKELENIQKLASDGFAERALENVDTLLLSQPSHFSARLTRSRILLQLNRLNEAEELLKQLIASHPQRPEPLNNLAVLIASEGDYKTAVDTLLKAFETHPSYANVQKNLSELYATMASQAYSKALDLETQVIAPRLAALSMEGTQQSPGPLPFIPAKSVSETVAELAAAQTASQPAGTAAAAESPTSEPKPDSAETLNATEQEIIAALAKIEQQVSAPETTTPGDTDTGSEKIDAATDSATKQATLVATATVEQEARAEATEPTQAAVSGKAPGKEPDKERAEPQQSADDSLNQDRVASQTEPAVAETTATTAETELDEARPQVSTAQEPSLDALKESAIRHVQLWADAWQRQDVKGYIAAYAPGYSPANGMSHDRWKRQRQSRLTKPSFIQVKLSDIKVSLRSGKQAEVRFLQRYSSDNYSDRTQKKLQLIRLEDGWRIAKERSF